EGCYCSVFLGRRITLAFLDRDAHSNKTAQREGEETADEYVKQNAGCIYLVWLNSDSTSKGPSTDEQKGHKSTQNVKRNWECEDSRDIL
ncbi:Hypothetical predicted protein, partial [Podarcis lilfordi]